MYLTRGTHSFRQVWKPWKHIPNEWENKIKEDPKRINHTRMKLIKQWKILSWANGYNLLRPAKFLLSDFLSTHLIQLRSEEKDERQEGKEEEDPSHQLKVNESRQPAWPKQRLQPVRHPHCHLLSAHYRLGLLLLFSRNMYLALRAGTANFGVFQHFICKICEMEHSRVTTKRKKHWILMVSKWTRPFRILSVK